ncbi:MAG TPA: serine/threonine-protein kinase [Lacipirellulaceae bacterium]|nr:serine/threonine-protein kinase [Lacipirellulaceae bacterium]
MKRLLAELRMQLTHLGPYVIEKPLGKGGMGSVYAATDPQTEQRVAIKALSPQLALAEGFRERFEAEIESLKTLRHDGIVRLYGYGEQDGVLFYSMELVDGISLEDELKAGRRFNWREVTSIAIQLSLALKHAHDHGIVHRDIKPANILLTEDERVKLADFGIARLFGTTSLTTAGGVLGTADYMSPEQADGRPVTARCDQYSLGGVMYALLAGRPPFRAKNLPQMLQLQRFASPEPVRRYAPDTPEQLEHVIAQLLAKDPADRFPNTQVLARHLQAMANALSRPAADDFALSSDQSPAARSFAQIHESISSEATQAEPQSFTGGHPRSPAVTSAAASQNAATLPADGSPAVPSVEAGSRSSSKDSMPLVNTPIARESRFTTVEEEEALRQTHQGRSWILIISQVAVFLAIIAAGAYGIRYVSQPPSADKLYAAITSKVDGDDDPSLGKVENEVDEFLKRFPNDSRADLLKTYKETIQLDRLDRKLQRQTRGTINPPLLPIEQQYLDAISSAAMSPEKGISQLSALVDLYDDGATNDATDLRPTTRKQKLDRDMNDRTANVVLLAKRRIQGLRADLAKQREEQLTALGERLAAAESLVTTNPERAAAIFRAIVNLHGDDAWADAVVRKARDGLVKLQKKEQR